jgi:predicted XRE-type DNA-binding protein
MTAVLEARQAFDDARKQASAMVARKRAQLGLAMIQARETRRESQASIARKLGIVTEQVRRYEQAYRDWVEDHPGESLD